MPRNLKFTDASLIFSDPKGKEKFHRWIKEGCVKEFTVSILVAGIGECTFTLHKKMTEEELKNMRDWQQYYCNLDM